MSISYSTNWMGPISLDWYRERGLTQQVWKKVESEFVADLRKMDIGESYLAEEITTHYAGGRIDIRGVPDEPYGLEYSLAPMRAEDWNRLSEWLDALETDDVWEFTHLIDMYEKTNPKIRWAKEIDK